MFPFWKPYMTTCFLSVPENFDSSFETFFVPLIGPFSFSCKLHRNYVINLFELWFHWEFALNFEHDLNSRWDIKVLKQVELELIFYLTRAWVPSGQTKTSSCWVWDWLILVWAKTEQRESQFVGRPIYGKIGRAVLNISEGVFLGTASGGYTAITLKREIHPNFPK